MLGPPVVEPAHELPVGGGKAGVTADHIGDGAALCQLRADVHIGFIALPQLEAALAQRGVVAPVVAERVDFGHRHAALQMRAYVMRLRRRGVRSEDATAEPPSLLRSSYA